MDNVCVFCGEPIEGGKLTCDKCEVIVKDLTPEQKRVLYKVQADEEAREAFRVAAHDMIESLRGALDIITGALYRFIQVVNPIMFEEDEDGNL